MANAGLTASTHPAATSTALSFDFMAVNHLDAPPQPPPAWLLKSPVVNLSQGCIFWTRAGARRTVITVIGKHDGTDCTTATRRKRLGLEPKKRDWRPAAMGGIAKRMTKHFEQGR